MKFTPNRGNLLLPYFSFYEKFEAELINSLLLMDTSSVLLLDGASGNSLLILQEVVSRTYLNQ
jgi:hypothetical protein